MKKQYVIKGSHILFETAFIKYSKGTSKQFKPIIYMKDGATETFFLFHLYANKYS